MTSYNPHYQRARLPGPGNEALIYTHNTVTLQNLEAGIPYVGLPLGQPARFVPNLSLIVQPSAGIPVGGIIPVGPNQPLMQNPMQQFPSFLGG